MEVTIGGERLGSGKKMKAQFNNYERSTHDLSYLWRSTMASGTLVPFMSELALPGDTFDINLGCSILTHPTIGPLFGSYKVQLDVFQVPIRLYQAGLHMNMLDIGMKMNTIKLPQLELTSKNDIDLTADPDNQQINPSCLLSYLGIRGLGLINNQQTTSVTRYFNAVPYLAYWDIYKNYYANKQEEIGACIHTELNAKDPEMVEGNTDHTNPTITIAVTNLTNGTTVQTEWASDSRLLITCTDLTLPTYPENIYMNINDGEVRTIPLVDLFWTIYLDYDNQTIVCYDLLEAPEVMSTWDIYGIFWQTNEIPEEGKPNVVTFDLKNIDSARLEILQHPLDHAYIINSNSFTPYNYALQANIGLSDFSMRKTQEGLAIKTYQSDLFNNWLSTEWIDGEDGISAITSVDTSGDSFTIDELNMSRKIYDMLNRIALSGGTYDDWLDAVYTHERTRGQENPVYLGGLIKELVFQEVISNSASGDEPLGTLAGRGVLSGKHKGGQIIAKIDEPSYIIGIVSLTPRVDYSQGNKWDTNLKTLDDFHKPALDQIGFQDLITDQMAWFDTVIDSSSPPVVTFKSAGKQPAWINYMTNVNQVRGNFADANNQMFMVLNRRYEHQRVSDHLGIKDLTTYIDPSKFNHVFADTRLDAQNFWCQISLDITARRKMSAKIIPNL